KYTFIGDVNLDRTVAIADEIDLASHINQAGGWREGDLNYDGQVGISDFIDLTAHFANSQPLSPTISGPSWSGVNYTLNLSNTTGTTTGWTVDWGDGDVEWFSGNPSSVNHVYDDLGTYTIEASARGSYNIAYRAAQTISSTIVG